MPQCPVCGLGYDPNTPEDLKYHRKVHDAAVNGLPAPPIKSDHIIWKQENSRIAVVNYFSHPAQRRRAERIGYLAHDDTEWDFAPYHASEELDERHVHLFLGYAKNRGITFFLVEKRTAVWRYTWEEYDSQKQLSRLINHKPVWSVGLAWVNMNHRRQGWAVRLANEASLFFGLNVQQLGWYTPFSESGEALVRNLCPHSFYIAK